MRSRTSGEVGSTAPDSAAWADRSADHVLQPDLGLEGGAGGVERDRPCPVAHDSVGADTAPGLEGFHRRPRVWPEDANKRGDVFFSFSPTRNKDWTLLPGRDYTLRYRLLVYDGTVTAEQAEAVWKSFAAMPQVKALK